MPGKMTILDRLMQQGKIKPRPNETMWSRGDFRDPLNYTFAQRQSIKAHPESFQRLDITPERMVYQEGLENIRERNIRPILSERTDKRGELSDVQKEFNRAAREAHAGMKDEYYDRLENYEPANIRGGVYDEEFEIDVPSSNNLRDYWPDDYNSPDWYSDRGEKLDEELNIIEDRLDYAHSPEYLMQLQTQSPRFRNYQRAMQQRAANRRMGHQLGRMWGDAYNRLRTRGLSDAEARMYLHDYFGGR